MARNSTRRRSSRRTPRLDFAAIEITGALLTPDIVARIASFDAADQTEEAYGVPPGLKIRDEIARYFRIAEALWHQFEAAKVKSPAASERFMLDLLKQCLGFDTIKAQKAIRKGEREFPIRHAALGGRVPVVIAPVPDESVRRTGIDESLTQFGDGSRRRSATLLLQEYLNAEDDALWGMCADGLTLRLLRDNVSLTRPAWIEADLAKIFTESLFPDFSALWLLIHQSRFGAAGSTPTDCALEHWRDAGRIEGTAARERLRDGVEAALIELGQGFIEHPANAELRAALSQGKLTRQGYFEELLRLVYRLIFLFAAEDRQLLHVPGAPQAATKAYASGYSLTRLRERCIRRTAWDRHGDTWEGLKATFRALSDGESLLGLPALGGLFAQGQLPHLRGARIENRRLLAAIWRLAWMRPEGQPLTRVNWRDMRTEELGSVYESLLELTPLASADTRIFSFAEGDGTRGNTRKTTGSYYTPEPLVKLVLDTALEPLLEMTENSAPDDPTSALLRLSIVDPACGSGHFLLGAAQRIASRIAKVRSPIAPSMVEYQHALRNVISNCIYGVDRNPLAVELCKVALWIEALEPGKPLSFLDSHIRCGDSLVGVLDLGVLNTGIPDAAYEVLTGDEPHVARALSRFNKSQRDGLASTGFLQEFAAPDELIDASRAMLEMPEDTLEQIAAKKFQFDKLHEKTRWQTLQTACDLYVTAFFIPKNGNPPSAQDLDNSAVPLTSHIWDAARGKSISAPLLANASSIARAASAFHWHLEFPHVFSRGGFNAVLGNPPWERIKLVEQEFFASRSPAIASAPTKAARGVLIEQLRLGAQDSGDARLLAEFEFSKRIAEAGSEFARNSGRFPLTGTGDVNTYALFAELFAQLTHPEGRSGVLVPTGIATDSSTAAFFSHLIDTRRLRSLFSFYEIRQWFKGTDDRKSFCVLCTGAGSGAAEFCFEITSIDELSNVERRFKLTPDQIAAINPNSKTVSVFRSRYDAQLTAQIYARNPVLVLEPTQTEETPRNPWGITFQTMFHMSNDSSFFVARERLERDGWSRDGQTWVRTDKKQQEVCVPLYEAKMVHHYDHRWATFANALTDDEDAATNVTLDQKQQLSFEPDPRHWVPQSEVRIRAARIPASAKRAWREGKPNRCLRALAEWICGFYLEAEGRPAREKDLFAVLGREGPWRAALGKANDRWLMEEKTNATARKVQRATPLLPSDLPYLKGAAADPLAAVTTMIDLKQPRWFMGWRDISLRSVERTVIGTVLPCVGVGNNLPLWHVSPLIETKKVACLLSFLSSLPFDYIGRLKIAGTHLNFFIAQQLPVIEPEKFSSNDVDFIVPRVLELTFTTTALKPWAEDLGHLGAPFPWNEDKRAILRAELDAYISQKLQLTRDELRYILDPADLYGSEYPSETFRVLKNSDIAKYGEYRTAKLVLDAWDRLERGELT